MSVDDFAAMLPFEIDIVQNNTIIIHIHKKRNTDVLKT